MEFTKEFVEENQLNDSQIAAISDVVTKYVNTELGVKVHEHTESSLSKIWETVKTVTGIEREQGEKYADALQRASGLYFEGEKNSLARKQKELEEKIKNVKGDESLKSELETTKEALQALKQKEAEYDEWAKNDYKGKYETTLEKLTNTERRVAFASIRPSKPENVNEYEWNAKWKDFEKKAIEENNIVFDEDGEAWAVNKENEFKKTKLSDLVKENETIQELVKGREQRGTGIKDKQVQIEGVPFKIKENATPQERQAAIKEYLASQNISPTSAEYSAKFAELNASILGLKKKSA